MKILGQNQKIKNEIDAEYLQVFKAYNSNYTIIDPPKDPVMRDDGCGFGDLIACCPECGEPFISPIWWKGRVWVCNNCGTLLKTSHW